MTAMTDDLTLRLLLKLVSYPTVSGQQKDTNECFDYLEKSLVDSKMHVTRLSSNGFPSIIATSQITKSPHILLQAHIDVVPARDELFNLTEKDSKLYGRGVFDMKFAAACYLALVDEIKNSLAKYDFGIMFTSDEEIGGKNGVSYLLDHGYSAKVCILPDGGNDWHIETTCNALWIVRIISDGLSAHGSRPWEGRNAINSLLEALRDIHDMFGELKPFKNSVTISKIQGGLAINQVPDSAEATVDMRFTNNQEHSNYQEKIIKIIKTKGLRLETVASVEARSIDISQSEVASFLTITGKIIGEPVTEAHSFGASDAYYFAQHNIPAIVIRPPGGGAHSANEWIDKAGLLQFSQVIMAYITTEAQLTK